MRIYLAVVARTDCAGDRQDRRAVITEAIRVAHESISASLPSLDAPTATMTAVAPSSMTALMAWTNEPGDAGFPPLVTARAGVSCGLDGYLNRPGERMALTASTDLGSTVANTGGCFSVVRTSDDGIEAATVASATAPLYHAESPHLRIVGTRGLLVNLVAQHDAGRGAIPAFRPVALRPLVISGSTLDDLTPYTGVHVVAPSSILSSTGRRSDVQRWRPTDEPTDLEPSNWLAGTAWGRRRRTKRCVTAVADALVAAVEPLAGRTDSVGLALTGGRDSRLLAAALHASRVPFDSVTNGPMDHPDVVLASRIAERLGVTHTVRTPTLNTERTHALIEHPVDRARRIHDVSDGMISVWDDVGDYGPMKALPALSGVGGETLRGGYIMLDRVDVSGEVAAATVMNLYAGQPALFQPMINEEWRQRAAPWARLAEREPIHALQQLWLAHRVHRWGGIRRQGATLRRPMYVPLHDNQVTIATMDAQVEHRWSERLVHDVIRHLAPSLADLPIEGQRWRFDRTRPEGRRALRRWERRHALTADPHPAVSWNRLHDDQLRNLIRDVVMDSFGHPVIDELLSRDGVEDYFGSGPPRHPVLAWNLLGVAVLTNDEWWRGPRTARTTDLRVRLHSH